MSGVREVWDRVHAYFSEEERQRQEAEAMAAAQKAATELHNRMMYIAYLQTELARRHAEIALQVEIEALQGKMWVITGFEKLAGKVVGSGQCPGIVQSYGGLPLTKTWFAGPKVRDRTIIPAGTAIATFVNGRYPNKAHGNHVAIYVKQDSAKGLYVFDQWTGRAAGYRWMKWGDGVSDPSNDGAAMSIILTSKTI